MSALRAQSTSFDNELHAHEGPDNPDLVIEPGTTSKDPDGSPTNGLTVVQLSSNPLVDEESYIRSFVTVNNDVMNNGAEVEDVLKHELGHVHDARTNTFQYLWDNDATAQNHGQIPGVCKANCHDQRPEERRANDFKAQVNRDTEQHKKDKKRKNKQNPDPPPPPTPPDKGYMSPS